MVDLHCHILPEIDDGAMSFDEAVSMAKIAAQEGIDTIVATPHFIEQKDFEELISATCRQKQLFDSILAHHGIDVTILTGAEVYINPFLADIENLKDLCINRSRYMLIELPMGDIPRYTGDVIYKLRIRGVVPVIAHPERNLKIIANPNLLYSFVDLGALAQVNSGSISGMFGRQVQRCARVLIEHNMVHVLGTDAHSDRTRAPRVKRCFEILCKWFGDDKLEQMTRILPGAIIADSPFDVDEPKEYKKRSAFFLWFKR